MARVYHLKLGESRSFPGVIIDPQGDQGENLIEH